VAFGELVTATAVLLATDIDADVGTLAALCPLAGVPAVTHAVRALWDSGVVDAVVVVAPVSYRAAISAVLPAGTAYSPGGSTRHASVHSGLTAVDGRAGTVVLHDASRPLVPASVVAAVCAAVAGGAGVAVPAVPMTETVKEIDTGARVVRTVPRDGLLRLQSPAAVRHDLLVAAHESCSGSDPDGPLAPAGTVMSIVDGSALGFAIRGVAERALAEALLEQEPLGHE
jgi:2-C-methyl-D-erythritol 4-phosphate cytidylyltransferase